MLTTPRLTLRSPRAEDLRDLNSVYGNAQAMRYWSTPPHSLDDTRAFLTRFMAAERPGALYFVIDLKGRAIGTAGLHSGTEVGYILHPDHWRQGIVQEAMTAINNHIFDTTPMPYLTADIDPRNTASEASLRRLGFTLTGFARNTFCVAGEWSDSKYFTRYRP